MRYQKHLNDIERVKGVYPEPGLIRLASAERDEPYPKRLWEIFIDNLQETDVRYYPDFDYAVKELSKHVQVPPQCLTIGHGSDSVIKNVFECFVSEGSKVVTTDPCFPMYKIYGQIRKAEVCAVPYSDKRVDVPGIIEAIDDNTTLVVVSNPSSPIGDPILDVENIIRAAARKNCMVLVDEAYAEFCRLLPSMIHKYKDYGNVIVTRTFSKAAGSAGMRFGYGVSGRAVTNLLAKVKSIYEITGPTIEWMRVIINNWDLVEEYVAQVTRNKYHIIEQYEKQGYEVHDGHCNWIHTTKTDFDKSIHTKRCTLPWDDRQWTRLCIPSDEKTMELILR